MLWQDRCGSLCEMRFISVVCGLAAIQKQQRLVDRAFNRASEPASQAPLQTSASLPVSHFWLLPFPPTHFSALSLFPNPPFPDTASNSYLHHHFVGCTPYLPSSPDTFFFFSSWLLSAGLVPLLKDAALCTMKLLPKESAATHSSQPHAAPWSHMPWGTSTNKSHC